MKLRRKLLSAGFALGATALTLTTSTFAWYTANNQVEVDAIKGATSATADSSSLYIAAASTYASVTEETKTYVKPGADVLTTTTYATTQTPVLVGNPAEGKRVLTPVAYHGVNQYGTLKATSAGYEYNASAVTTGTALEANTYYERTGEENAYVYTLTTDASAVENKTYYVKGDRKPDTITYEDDKTCAYVYEYVLRFQKPNATTPTPIYVSQFDLTNTATSTKSAQQALTYDNPDGTTTGTMNDGKYNVDMLHALKMTVAVTGLTSDGKYTDDESIAEANRVARTTVRTVYDLDGFADADKDVNIGTKANAVGYYNNVLGTNIVKPATYLDPSTTTATNTWIDATKCIASAATAENLSTHSVLFTIPATGFVEVRFTFWLDGWDEFCYDVCQQQNFEVKMSFSTQASNSVLNTYTARTGKPAANQEP